MKEKQLKKEVFKKYKDYYDEEFESNEMTWEYYVECMVWIKGQLDNGNLYNIGE